MIVDGESEILPISFSQQYILPDWHKPPVVQDFSGAPKNGFTFANAMLATPVVWIQPPAATGSAAVGDKKSKPVASTFASKQLQKLSV